MLSNLLPFQNTTSQSHRSRGSDLRRELPDHTSIPVNLEGGREENGTLGRPKDAGPMDWYTEGPGRRVGYDDMTAIDWIFEYTKERQRIRRLYSGSKGFLRQLRLLLDGSQVWLVLVATGVAVGILAACIDIASNWLGDIKTGYCQSGGSFYLNKSFCCWGYDG
jgi:chloride channel 3/4/5